MENFYNSIHKMIIDSDFVYVDGCVIKNKYSHSLIKNHPNVDDVMENIDDYYIVSFNRDPEKGSKYLELNSSIENENTVSIFPTQQEIDEQIYSYGFRVPYDGTNEFYDKVAIKRYKAGIEWVINRIKNK